MKQLPNLPLELLQKQTKLDLSIKENRKELEGFCFKQ